MVSRSHNLTPHDRVLYEISLLHEGNGQTELTVAHHWVYSKQPPNELEFVSWRFRGEVCCVEMLDEKGGVWGGVITVRGDPW